MAFKVFGGVFKAIVAFKGVFQRSQGVFEAIVALMVFGGAVRAIVALKVFGEVFIAIVALKGVFLQGV